MYLPAAASIVAVPQDPFLQSPLRRLLSTTWPLFRAFRVDVRASWTIAIWPVFFIWGYWSWMGPLGAIAWGLAWTLGLFAAVYVHEMGHIVAGRHYGIDTSMITLRGLGGLAHLDSEASGPKQDIVIALAGPATHLLWLIVLWPLELLFEPELVRPTWWWMLSGYRGMHVALLLFNLVPFYPLDGGRVFRSLMALKMNANKATLIAARVGMVGWVLAGLVSLGFWVGGVDLVFTGHFDVILLWLAIEGFFACRRLAFRAKYDEIFGYTDPFAKALYDSKAIEERAKESEDKEKAKRRKSEEKRASERAALQAQVDALLDRITEVGGIEGLSPRERKDLARASQALSAFDARD